MLFFGHNFSDRLRFYSEFEVEHAVSSAGDRGEAEVEQAYLDGLLGRRLSLRGGLIIMPVGIINVYHEPPTFNGVDRPAVDTYVIPTTWREPGVGDLRRDCRDGLRYQLYVDERLQRERLHRRDRDREKAIRRRSSRTPATGAASRASTTSRVWATIFGGSAYYATSGNSLTSTVGKVPVS